MPTSGRLDIKRLRVFSQAARASSFARAAEVLGYSPSAISQQISTLERDLGVVLFERGARGVRLTDAGSALLGHAEVVLEKIDEAESQIESIAGLTGGELRFGWFGSFTSATAVFAAAAVEEFRASYPAVEVRFVDGEPFESISRLVAGELDLALVFDFDRWRAGRSYEGVLLPAENGLRLLPLFDDPFLLLVPRAHRLAASESVTMHDLAGETILGAPPWVDDVEHLCRAAGVDVEIDRSRRATGFEAFQAFVALGRGSRSCRDSPWAGAGRRSYRFRSRAIRSGTSRPRSWHAPTTRQPSRPCPRSCGERSPRASGTSALTTPPRSGARMGTLSPTCRRAVACGRCACWSCAVSRATWRASIRKPRSRRPG